MDYLFLKVETFWYFMHKGATTFSLKDKSLEGKYVSTCTNKLSHLMECLVLGYFLTHTHQNDNAGQNRSKNENFNVWMWLEYHFLLFYSGCVRLGYLLKAFEFILFLSLCYWLVRFFCLFHPTWKKLHVNFHYFNSNLRCTLCYHYF